MEALLTAMAQGLTNASAWQIILFTLAVTHITIASVTIFLHRHQAHRALDLHPLVSHFFRFWLWLTTGQVTKEWAAVHRKHHAKCESEQDPHSPQVKGIKTVFWKGAELYKVATRDAETLQRYGHGTPNDWLEKNLYTRHSAKGIFLMLAIDLALFGVAGLSVWAVQMAWIPVTAAGIINGIGHYWGYRNYDSPDAARNISPWGILIGGEELHNNHHTYASSAKLSSKWYEFDIGWFYIRTLEVLKLASVKKRAPIPVIKITKKVIDAATLEAVITNRYEILARYKRLVSTTFETEVSKLVDAGKVGREKAHQWKLSILKRKGSDAELLSAQQELFVHSESLAFIHQMREELIAIWARTHTSAEILIQQLRDWCEKAERSGITSLMVFAERLRCYS